MHMFTFLGVLLFHALKCMLFAFLTQAEIYASVQLK